MLRLFGLPRQLGKGMFPAKAYDIAALVTLMPGKTIGRAELVAMLWSETAPELAFANLRYVVFAVRRWQRLNSVVIFNIERDRLSKFQGGSDLDEFLSWQTPRDEHQVSALASLWAGDLLEGHDDVSPEFDGWLTTQREWANRRFLDLILGASETVRGDQMGRALDIAAERFPYNDRVVRAQIDNLVLANRQQAAEEAFLRFRRKLRVDLGSEVDVLTKAWAASLFSAAGNPRARTASQVPLTVPLDDGRHPRYAGLPRVLVLPPEKAGGTASSAEQHLVRSLVSEVTIVLGKMRTFTMFAPHTARQLDAANPLAAADRVSADYVVSTQLVASRHNASPALGFSLIHMASQEILIADVLSTDRAHLCDTGNDLAGAVASSVSGHIAKAEMVRFRKAGEASAYTHYLLGHERLEYDLKSIRQARKHFRRAAELSPRFAAAHAMVARTMTYEWLVLGRPETDLLLHAQAIATHAIEMDPLDPSGHWEYGHSLLYMRDLDESLHHVEVALSRAPHVADLLSDQADVLVHLGEARRAKGIIHKAIDLNPLAPDSYYWVKASSEFLLEDYAASIRAFSQMKNTGPVSRLMAAGYAMIGDLENARLYRERWQEQYPDFRLADWVKVIPMKRPEATKQIVDAMRRAGFT